MEVQSPPGTTIGWVKQDCTFIYPQFSITNADGDTILEIKGPFCTCKCWDVNFNVIIIESMKGLLIEEVSSFQSASIHSHVLEG